MVPHGGPRYIVGVILDELTENIEALLVIAQAMANHVASTESEATPQNLREMAALVKSAALALGMASANVVGDTERLKIVATIAQGEEPPPGNPPS